LAAAIDAILPPLLEHLSAEETYLLALIDKHLTDGEWAEVGRAAMAETPKSLLPMVFGMVLRDAEPSTWRVWKRQSRVRPGSSSPGSGQGPTPGTRVVSAWTGSRTLPDQGRRGLPCTGSGTDGQRPSPILPVSLFVLPEIAGAVRWAGVFGRSGIAGVNEVDGQPVHRAVVTDDGRLALLDADGTEIWSSGAPDTA
jgi:hypothetical protein